MYKKQTKTCKKTTCTKLQTNYRQKQEQLKLSELEKQREREEKRKEKHLKKIQERGQVEISQKIRIEERKLMIAQRKLESIRILEQVFERIQLKQKQKSHRARQDDVKDLQRGRLVEKYKTATEKLVCDQRKIVQEIKSNTPLMGLLKGNMKKGTAAGPSSDDELAGRQRPNGAHSDNVPLPAASVAAGAPNAAMNPFKAVTAALAAGAVPATAAAANEWMQSLSMFGYGMPPVFPGAALYRAAAPPPFAVSSNYRGFAPRPRGRGRGRGGRGSRSGYDGYSSSYYNPKHYEGDRYGDEADDGYYHKSSRGRNRSRSRSNSYSRSRSRSRGRRLICRSRRSHSRSRSRSRSHNRRSSYSSRSRRSHSRSRSRSRSKNPSQRKNRKLASTRRSRSSSYSSRSRSRSRSKHSSSRRERRSRSRSAKRVVLEADKLVASAEQIQRTIEQHAKDQLRDEVREIKQNFRHQRKDSHVLQDNRLESDVRMKDKHSSREDLRTGDGVDNDQRRSGSRRNSIAA
ncbi:A-kinase anchor protein 17A isoform X2 [Drosophila busckii]|uniref:A-kinase anchor protein 17A isoform X2 n=1 Tax=Drosophila busckii TaxID=30019 RepID=UPI00083EFA65|nr:A-kinase anchor protein 17A isoform X2 [Drosophila busckii]